MRTLTRNKTLLRGAKFASALVLLLCIGSFVVGTAHWTLISDAVLMHYIVFLTHHGLAPYREIIDINLPGTYLLDAGVVRVFGSTAAGWRLYDFSLLLLASGAIVLISRAYSLWGGLLAAALFALLHGADGVAHAGERDFSVAVFLLAGCASLLVAFRQQSSSKRSIGALAWGVCVGWSATMKPQFLLAGFAGLLLISIVCRRRKFPFLLPIAVASLGIALPIAAVILFLVRQHALGAFLHRIVPLVLYHASLGRHSTAFLIGHALPSKLLPLFLAALIGSAWGLAWSRWEGALLAAFAAVGFFSFVAQGKAYSYHRAALVGFVLCLATVQLIRSLQAANKRVAVTSLLALSYAVLWLAPASTVKALRWNCVEPSLVQLENDLTSFSESTHESGGVQCMDTTAGCITALSRLHLVQSTGFLYDCYFFAPQPSATREAERQLFLQTVTKPPPALYVIT